MKKPKTSYADFQRPSTTGSDAFWSEQDGRIDWHTPFTQECDYKCLLYTSPSPRHRTRSRITSSA